MQSDSHGPLNNPPHTHSQEPFDGADFLACLCPPSSPFQPPLDKRARTLSSSTWEEKTQEPPKKPPARRGRRSRKRSPELEESQYETDHTTAVESSDEQDADEWGR